ncbi:unnamed protein product [Amoebophrya sp. A25]|nr:unnamed protein product [Amoebophrya sp. A25]|eukprot:GSA25T00009286001.1
MPANVFSPNAAKLADTKKYYKASNHITRQNDDRFDRQRFENYTAWLDTQSRAMQKSETYFFGRKVEKPLYGFEPPRELFQKDKQEKPFVIQEPSFTSGTVCARKYDKNYIVTDDKLEDLRADPYHEPNFMAIKTKDHFGDHRSGSRHPMKERLPQLWRPVDKELRKAVPQEMVDSWMKANGGDSKKSNKTDPTFQVLFRSDNDVLARSNAQRIRELNLDTSTTALPHYLEEQKKGLPPPPEPPVIGEDSLLPADKTGRIFKNHESARLQNVVRKDERFVQEIDHLYPAKEFPPPFENQGALKYAGGLRDPKATREEFLSPRSQADIMSVTSPRSSPGGGRLPAKWLGKHMKGDALKEYETVTGVTATVSSPAKRVYPEERIGTEQERLAEWKSLAKVPAHGVKGGVKEILRQSSILLKVQQHPPVVPRKVFVSGADFDRRGWDRDTHRNRMRYRGGTAVVSAAFQHHIIYITFGFYLIIIRCPGTRCCRKNI